MRASHLIALISAILVVVGAVTGVAWVAITAGIAAAWFLLVAEIQDEAIRTVLAVASIPVILAAAMITSS